MSLTFLPETTEWFSCPQLGKVEQTITPSQQGRIRFMATFWFARLYRPNAHNQIELLPGTTVKILGRQGLTLIIVPLGSNIHPQILSGAWAEAHQKKKVKFSALDRFCLW